jgi:hypothetical protein
MNLIVEKIRKNAAFRFLKRPAAGRRSVRCAPPCPAT